MFPAAPSDLAFSRTVLAMAPEVDVPAELRAAVLVPAAAPVPAPVPSAPPKPAPEPLAAPTASVQRSSEEAQPLPPASHYLPAAVEPTPAFATVAFDVPAEVVSPRRRFRAGSVLAVTATAMILGFGLTLLIGRATEEAPATVASPQSSAMGRVSPARTALAQKAEPPAKSKGTVEGASRETSARAAAEPPREPAQVPVSSTTVPSCRELLGDAFLEKTDPEAALAETQIGNREMVRGKVDATHRAFCKAALWDGAKIERWLNLAQLFLIRRDASKAVETAERALQMDPKNARALEIVGDASARLGKLQEARRAYLAAERRPEADDDALRWLVRRDLHEAQRSVKSGDFVRAERLFLRVVVFDSEHPGAARGVAACLRKLNEAKASEAWARRAEMLERSAARKG